VVEGKVTEGARGGMKRGYEKKMLKRDKIIQ
jgi:hypothetical protein